MSNECKKLFGLMKFDVEGAVCNIGLEKLFFVPRDKYYSRQDLQFTGRTLGKMCARGQEGCDHYMGPINMNGPVLKCMQEIQFEYTCAGGRAFEPPSSIRTSGGRARPWGFSSRSAAVRRRRRRSSTAAAAPCAFVLP